VHLESASTTYLNIHRYAEKVLREALRPTGAVRAGWDFFSIDARHRTTVIPIVIPRCSLWGPLKGAVVLGILLEACGEGVTELLKVGYDERVWRDENTILNPWYKTMRNTRLSAIYNNKARQETSTLSTGRNRFANTLGSGSGSKGKANVANIQRSVSMGFIFLFLAVK
jgi:hypothetical protein